MIKKGKHSRAVFSGGIWGHRDAGNYTFWVARFNKGANRVARVKSGDSPIRRFDFAYILENKKVMYVRPAKTKEIESWLDLHRVDAKYLEGVEVEGRFYYCTFLL